MFVYDFRSATIGCFTRYLVKQPIVGDDEEDDRISALETQMAAQQAGYETQKRLNEQMMEMMKRMYPNEVFPNIQDP
ncbi:hypothetical protein IGI04_009570 [Brassica rapa subsp. trilocularis]|uniref:Uncharacterized protein n=1 Tax=Brassica rapa subsp. trilocularis TaxID=1813537 RepID=A0ABQ7N025_BRACM|nr:hypothetical protein IGI04_009570 [Brassica rapa subsp. trilocularis]